jgi:hypothetical protein
VRFPNGTFRKKSDIFFDDRVMALVWSLFVLETELCQQYFEIVDLDMQGKPLKIKHNGFWERIESFYELKQLDEFATIVPKIYKPEEEIVNKTLDVKYKEIDINNKYEEDLFDLLAQGYTFL